MDPLAQGGISKVQRVGHRLEALAFDNLAHGLGTTEDPGFLRLLEIGIEGGEGLIRKVEFESPHCGVSRKKLLQKFTRAQCLLILLSEQNLSDSNFPGAALHGTPSAPPIPAQRVARFDDHCTRNCLLKNKLRQRYSRSRGTRPMPAWKSPLTTASLKTCTISFYRSIFISL